MGFCFQGLQDQSFTEECVELSVGIEKKHPLIQLANTLDWNELYCIIEQDLKSTTACKKWWLGRKLTIRTHLGVYLLQQMLNETDRGIEERIRHNALYQVFCGKLVLENWRCPDHTKIEEFRSRLKPETQCHLTNAIAQYAHRRGFATAEWIDLDSTIQEPNAHFPSVAELLMSLSRKAKRIEKLLVQHVPSIGRSLKPINLKSLAFDCKQYLFQKIKKIKDQVTRKKSIEHFWSNVTVSLTPVLNAYHWLDESFIKEKLNQRELKILEHFTRKALPLLTHSLERYNGIQAPMEQKILSIHLDELQFFDKQKPNKKIQFGRQFQIGRIAGNFVWSIPNTSLHMPDARSLPVMIKEHEALFNTPIDGIVTDRGYYAKENERYLLEDKKIPIVALPRPSRTLKNAPENPIDPQTQEWMFNYRSGIEAVISQIKHGGQLRRSRMKSDQTTQSAGYCAMLGFNLRQSLRYLREENQVS